MVVRLLFWIYSCGTILRCSKHAHSKYSCLSYEFLLLWYTFSRDSHVFGFMFFIGLINNFSDITYHDSWSSSLPNFDWSFRLYVIHDDGILSLICFNFPDYDGLFFHGFLYLILVFPSSRHGSCRCGIWFVSSCSRWLLELKLARLMATS